MLGVAGNSITMPGPVEGIHLSLGRKFSAVGLLAAFLPNIEPPRLRKIPQQAEAIADLIPPRGGGSIPSASLVFSEYAVLNSRVGQAARSPRLTEKVLGDIYQQGYGVQKDLSQAAKFFSQATNSGQAFAAFRLGEMYWNGEGVKKNKITAYELIYLASTAGVPQARIDRDNREKEMTPAEINIGRAKAAKFTPVGPAILKSTQPREN